MLDFLLLASMCAPAVHPETLSRLVHVESGFSPFAIGVVGGRLQRQPVNKQEALSTARMLEASGINYSVGLAQINRRNFARLGLSLDSAFDACTNLTAAQHILGECFSAARLQGGPEQHALHKAFSCYYSGNFHTGFRHGYVSKILSAPSLPPSQASQPKTEGPPPSAALSRRPTQIPTPLPGPVQLRPFATPTPPALTDQATSAILF